MFPKIEDQLDMHVIGKWLKRGRYTTTNDDARSGTLGVCTLLRDFDRMIANAKQFNECNADFLPWRQADMAQEFLNCLRKKLSKYHPNLTFVLSERIEQDEVDRQTQFVDDLAAEI